MDDELAATGREESDPGYLRNEELRKIFGKSEPTLERAQALWDRAYEHAARNAENGQKNTAWEGGEKTRYSTKNEVLAMPNIDWMEDDSSIKKQLRKHSDKISKTEPVAVVQYVHDKSESLVKIIMDQLPRIGGNFIKNKGVSFVFDKEGVNKIDAHATGPELRAAAMAAPYVAKYGELIAGQKNHEKTGITTLTFAAPVIINGDIVNVGVAIQFQAEGRPRAVNVDYNGNRFRINNEASRGTGSRVDHYSQGTSLPTRDASKISIPNSAEKVKGKFSLETADDQDIRYDLTDEEARKAPDPGHPNTLVTKGLFKSDQEVQLYA